MNYKPCCALILAILAGCGGSDNDDPTAVSPNPTAPVDTPAPAPAAPPENPPAAPAPTPVPPDEPAPPDAPPPVEPTASVRGDVLIAALGRSTGTDGNGADMGLAVATRDGYPSTSTFVAQTVAGGSPEGSAGEYAFSSAGYMNRDPFVASRYNLPAARIAGTWATAGSGDTATFALGPEMTGDTGQATGSLSKPAALVVAAAQRYELDQTLGEWQAADGAPAWKASLQLRPDHAVDLFRLCWKLAFPARARTSCGVFDRETGDWRGIHVVDDSLGFGRVVWRSRSLPPAPAGGGISGAALVKALSQARYADPVAGPAVGLLVEDDISTATFVEQRVEPDDPAAIAGRYRFNSAGYMNRGPGIPARYDLRDAGLTARWQLSGGADASFILSGPLDADDGQQIRALTRADTLAITAAETYQLDRTLAQWTSLEAPYPWDAALALHADEAQPAWFRLCWQMTYYPQVFRQSCGLFERQSGNFKGVHVVDDSENLGPLVWRTPDPQPQEPSHEPDVTPADTAAVGGS